MRTPNGLAVTVAALALVGVGHPRAQQTPTDGVPVFRTRVDAVSVDVGVVDRQGRPIPGLAATDFTVTVNGRPRRIVTAEFVDVAKARAERAALLVTGVAVDGDLLDRTTGGERDQKTRERCDEGTHGREEPALVQRSCQLNSPHRQVRKHKQYSPAPPKNQRAKRSFRRDHRAGELRVSERRRSRLQLPRPSWLADPTTALPRLP